MSYKKKLEKRYKEEEATAFAFQEFIKTFQASTPSPKPFIKSGIYNPGEEKKVEVEDKGKLYVPTSLQKQQNYDTNSKAIECARILRVDNRITNITTKKSNLEQLKEELQLRHKSEVSVESNEKKENDPQLENTTNLFLTHLNSKLNENDLMRIFGVYGPLASVKIMWPRVAERHRQNNIGFVAFMSRKDSERAYLALANRTDLRITWGKPITIPAHPIYLPPEMIKSMMPPPPSGLPFNAQRSNKTTLQDSIECFPDDKENELDLSNTFVRVVIPMDRKILATIHRTIEFVVKEGPLFEASIMHNEINNPLYEFLFDNKCSSHIYYRWKLFSIMNGETVSQWSTKPFRMFINGSIWFPPVVPDFTKGMEIKSDTNTLNSLSDDDQLQLIEAIQQLSPKRGKIADIMGFCMTKLAGARVITSIIAESFHARSGDLKTRGMKQIARLYLISDLLYNTILMKAISLSDYFKQKLPGIFNELNNTIEEYHENHQFNYVNAIKTRVLKVLRAWEMWHLFENDFLNQLEMQIFPVTDEIEEKIEPVESTITSNTCQDIFTVNDHEESQEPETNEINSNANFVKSKWTIINPAEVESQAMSTQKLYELEIERMLQEKRKLEAYVKQEKEYEELRRIEIKVIRFQDALESGKRKLKYCSNIQDEINEYRKRCIDKLNNKDLSSKRHKKYS